MIEARKLADSDYREVLSKRRDGLRACLDKYGGGDLRKSGMFAVSIPFSLADLACMEIEEEVFASRYD